jgi:hypothetical protein
MRRLALVQRIISGSGKSPHDLSLLITKLVPNEQPTHTAARASRLKLIVHQHLLRADYTWVWERAIEPQRTQRVAEEEKN